MHTWEIQRSFWVSSFHAKYYNIIIIEQLQMFSMISEAISLKTIVHTTLIMLTGYTDSSTYAAKDNFPHRLKYCLRFVL